MDKNPLGISRSIGESTFSSFYSRSEAPIKLSSFTNVKGFKLGGR
ncbi:hypothetical protein ACP70R_015846 [Stipagrostis hirtigluma subsp. patula]